VDPVDLSGLPDHALLLVDSAPIIYVLEDHREYSPRFLPLFEAHASGKLRFAVTTVTVAEVLTGPHTAGDEERAPRCGVIS